ncbi:MAG: thioredoxin [Saprospirales bacterium]|nr:MAG: thioredoxin [Saprospirales bacterium]
MTIQELAELSLKKPVLIDFWAEWCGPCKTFGPILEETLANYGDQIHLEKVDVDLQRDLAAQFRVQSIPTVVLLHNGKIVDVTQGAMSEVQLDQWLRKHLPGLESNTDDHDWREKIKELEPIPSSGRLNSLEELVREHPDDLELRSGYCRALLFDRPKVAKDMAADMAGNQEIHWLSTQIVFLANMLLDEISTDSLLAPILALIKSGELDTAAAKLNEQLLIGEPQEKEVLRKLGVSLFSVLGDQHPVNRKHRKVFNMYLS